MNKFSSERITALHNRAFMLLDAMRGQLDTELPGKELDVRFSIKQAAELVGRSPATIRRAEDEGALPSPPRRESGHRAGYTLEDLNNMRDHFGTRPSRSERDEAIVIGVQNFKGGVGKSTISVHLAQFLALKGYRVLFLDADPQASATSLFGVHPDKIDAETQTLLPIFAGDDFDAAELVRPTHWDGLDLIPSCLQVYNAEYMIAADTAGAAKDRLERLREALAAMTPAYDVVVCDPPPALGMISLSVLRSMNALVIPTPPSSLDYHSTVSFLEMLRDVLDTLERAGHYNNFKFVQFLATKVSENKSAHLGMRDAMKEMFGSDILHTALLDSAEFDNASVEMRTVYEYTGRSNSTYKRCRTNLDRVMGDIETAIRQAWPSHKKSLLAAGQV